MQTTCAPKIHQEKIEASIIKITDTDPDYIASYLASCNKAGTPIYTVLDLSSITTLETPAWIRNIRAIMKQHNMSLIGVREPQLNLEICKALRIPVIEEGTLEPAQTHTPKASTPPGNTYLHKPVRSGQQVYAQNGSLIITNSVSAGSEIAARDDIHIYHSCNGKVIAGTSGNTNAIICLFSGYPELISIAGITLHSNELTKIETPTLFRIFNGQLQTTHL